MRQIFVSVDEELYRALQERSARELLSLSATVRRMLAEAMEAGRHLAQPGKKGESDG